MSVSGGIPFLFSRRGQGWFLNKPLKDLSSNSSNPNSAFAIFESLLFASL
jgi:hypothetical protein